MMEGFRKLTVLFSVLLLSVVVQDAESCSCIPRDEQTKFCFSDVVAVVTIIGKKGFQPDATDITQSAEYLTEIKHVLKVPSITGVAKLPKEGSSNYLKLYTVPAGSLCGLVHLKIGETYLIGGGERDNQVHVNLCGLNVNWNSIAVEQQQYILENYLKNCKRSGFFDY